MNPIHRIRRVLARLAGPPGIVARPARTPPDLAGRRAGRPGPDGAATRFIQDMAAAASMAAGHQLGWPAHRPPPAGGGRQGQYDPASRFRLGHHIRPASDRGGT